MATAQSAKSISEKKLNIQGFVLAPSASSARCRGLFKVHDAVVSGMRGRGKGRFADE
jgi:hypothetical protein